MPVAFDDLIPAAGEKKSLSFDDLIPSKSTLGAPEIQAAEEQQAMERNAGATKTFADVKDTLRDMTNFPGKVAYSAAMIPGIGTSHFHWPTNEEVEKPLVPAEALKYAMIVPKVADYAAETFPNSPAQYVKPVTDALANTASGFTSPASVALLGLAPEGKLAQGLVAGTFLGQSIVGTPEQWRAFKEAKTVPEKIRIATEMGLSLALPAAALEHSRAGEVPKNQTPSLHQQAPEVIGESAVERSIPQAIPSELPQAQSTDPQARPRSPQPEITTPIVEPQRVSGEKEAVSEPVEAQGQKKPFIPSTEWQEVPDGTILPNGGEYRFDQKSGKNFARWKKENLPADTIPRSDTPTGIVSEPERPASAEVSSQPETTPTSERVNDDPFISRIANRFTQERAERGELGEVAPGQGYSTEDIISRGLKMSPEEINQHVSDIMRNEGNDAGAQAAAVRAEEARLSDRSTELSRVAEANPTNFAARQAANTAFQDVTDFHNGPVAKLKQRFHETGMGLQREVPVDLSTFNGLREAWLKDTGQAPPARMEPTFRKVAGNVTRAMAEEKTAVNRLGLEIEKVTRGRKLASAEEVRNSIVERMKDRPCRV
jgi:hypothetical protein